MDINWTSPGRLDPKLVEENLKASNESNTSLDIEASVATKQKDQDESESTSMNENPASMQAFDMIDEFTDDLAPKNLRITHKKTIDDSSSKRVACMDKILHDLKKNYDIEAKSSKNNEVASPFDVNEFMANILSTVETMIQ